MTDPNTITARIQRFRELREKATVGKWLAGGLRVVNDRGVIATMPTPNSNGVFECSQNPDFIAAAANDALPLLADCQSRIDTDTETIHRLQIERKTIKDAASTQPLKSERLRQALAGTTYHRSGSRSCNVHGEYVIVGIIPNETCQVCKAEIEHRRQRERIEELEKMLHAIDALILKESPVEEVSRRTSVAWRILGMINKAFGC